MWLKRSLYGKQIPAFAQVSGWISEIQIRYHLSDLVEFRMHYSTYEPVDRESDILESYCEGEE